MHDHPIKDCIFVLHFFNAGMSIGGAMLHKFFILSVYRMAKHTLLFARLQ